jgi:hypothetical protein
MDAIHVNQKLESETLYLPQVRPLIGKDVEIIVRESQTSPSTDNGASPREKWEAALAQLRDVNIDWDAIQRQRGVDLAP